MRKKGEQPTRVWQKEGWSAKARHCTFFLCHQYCLQCLLFNLTIASFIVFSLVLLNTVLGQSFVDTVVVMESKQYMPGKDAIGLSIGISYHSENFKYNYGIAKLNNPEQSTEKSVCSIGSISKTYIVMLLADAVLNKHVNLQDEIGLA